jgi:hypothetical protein
MRRGVLVMLVAATGWAAPSAAADPGQDAQFFQILDQYKIGYATRDDAIATAGSLCDALNRGVSFGQLETNLFTHGNPESWTMRDVDQFLFASSSAYCPQYASQVPQASLVPR